jgi:hypothetical protein
MVFIVGKYARLIRWDRGGAVVTEKIFYDSESHLYDFFIRYDVVDRSSRGHDCTVGEPLLKDIVNAKRKVVDRTFADAISYHTVTVSDRSFIIPQPICQSKTPLGWYTRASQAYDIQEDRHVFLKDSWRVLLDDIKPEGEIYIISRRKGSQHPSMLVR